MKDFTEIRTLILKLRKENRSYQDIAEILGMSYYKTWCIANGHDKNPHYDPNNMSESEKASRKKAMNKWNKKLNIKRKQERQVKQLLKKTQS